MPRRLPYSLLLLLLSGCIGNDDSSHAELDKDVATKASAGMKLGTAIGQLAQMNFTCIRQQDAHDSGAIECTREKRSFPFTLCTQRVDLATDAEKSTVTHVGTTAHCQSGF